MVNMYNKNRPGDRLLRQRTPPHLTSRVLLKTLDCRRDVVGLVREVHHKLKLRGAVVRFIRHFKGLVSGLPVVQAPDAHVRHVSRGDGPAQPASLVKEQGLLPSRHVDERARSYHGVPKARVPQVGLPRALGLQIPLLLGLVALELVPGAGDQDDIGLWAAGQGLDPVKLDPEVATLLHLHPLLVVLVPSRPVPEAEVLDVPQVQRRLVGRESREGGEGHSPSAKPSLQRAKLRNVPVPSLLVLGVQDHCELLAVAVAVDHEALAVLERESLWQSQGGVGLSKVSVGALKGEALEFLGGQLSGNLWKGRASHVPKVGVVLALLALLPGGVDLPVPELGGVLVVLELEQKNLVGSLLGLTHSLLLVLVVKHGRHEVLHALVLDARDLGEKVGPGPGAAYHFVAVPGRLESIAHDRDVALDELHRGRKVLEDLGGQALDHGANGVPTKEELVEDNATDLASRADDQDTGVNRFGHLESRAFHAHEVAQTLLPCDHALHLELRDRSRGELAEPGELSPRRVNLLTGPPSQRDGIHSVELRVAFRFGGPLLNHLLPPKDRILPDTTPAALPLDGLLSVAFALGLSFVFALGPHGDQPEPSQLSPARRSARATRGLLHSRVHGAAELE